jgi:hypothetical protein
LNQEDTKVKTSARVETPAEKESGKILPDDREGELRAFSAASEEKRAAGNPITTRSFNRAFRLYVKKALIKLIYMYTKPFTLFLRSGHINLYVCLLKEKRTRFARVRSHPDLLTDRTFHLELDEAVHFDRIFHRKFFCKWLDEAHNNHFCCFLLGNTAAHQIEELLF